MLETEYSGLFGRNQACWCPGSQSGHGISNHDKDSVGSQHVGMFHVILVSYATNQDMMQNVTTSLLTFKQL